MMRYALVGLDCPNCAAKLERELRKVKGLEDVKVNFNSLIIEKLISQGPRTLAYKL